MSMLSLPVRRLSVVMMMMNGSFLLEDGSGWVRVRDGWTLAGGGEGMESSGVKRHNNVTNGCYEAGSGVLFLTR